MTETKLEPGDDNWNVWIEFVALGLLMLSLILWFLGLINVLVIIMLNISPEPEALPDPLLTLFACAGLGR